MKTSLQGNAKQFGEKYGQNIVYHLALSEIKSKDGRDKQ